MGESHHHSNRILTSRLTRRSSFQMKWTLKQSWLKIGRISIRALPQQSPQGYQEIWEWEADQKVGRVLYWRNGIGRVHNRWNLVSRKWNHLKVTLTSLIPKWKSSTLWTQREVRLRSHLNHKSRSQNIYNTSLLLWTGKWQRSQPLLSKCVRHLSIQGMLSVRVI